jgi:hypothetical protein
LRAEEVLVKVATKIAGQAPGVLPLFTNYNIRAGRRDGFVSSGGLWRIRGGRRFCARLVFDAITFASGFALIDIDD